MRTPTRRLFFALWPDDAVRDRLDRAATAVYSACGGRRIDASRLHMTLLFIGATPEQQLPRLLATGAAIARASPVQFQIALDHCGMWKRAGVVWAAPGQTPVALAALAGALGTELDALGIRHDRREYRPHVTLVRDPSRRPEYWPAFDIHWMVTRFRLVESLTLADGSEYRALAEWQLA